MSAAALRIGGLTPFSTVDWPGRLAAVLFLKGCPWRCGYCHNPHLQDADGRASMTFASFEAWLATRAGLLDAVVFSGGEPTTQSALPEAMRAVRAAGFAVGLHTAGAYPRRLASALDHADWVGLDVKAPSRDYPAITSVAGSGAVAQASLRLVTASGVAHEVRTTVHPAQLDDDAMLRLADELAALGVRRWVLQPFRAAGCADDALVDRAPRGARIDARLVTRLRERVPGVEVRA